MNKSTLLIIASAIVSNTCIQFACLETNCADGGQENTAQGVEHFLTSEYNMRSFLRNWCRGLYSSPFSTFSHSYSLLQAQIIHNKGVKNPLLFFLWKAEHFLLLLIQTHNQWICNTVFQLSRHLQLLVIFTIILGQSYLSHSDRSFISPSGH